MTIQKKDFVELKYTGYANGTIFDSNIEEDLKTIAPKGTPHVTIVCVGEKMLVEGFDRALEGKEVGTKYEVAIPMQEAFGPRKSTLVRIIPLKVFTAQRLDPRPGMVLTLDNMIAKIIAVSGARVSVDFNNPLAGKDLKYVFTVTRMVDSLDERAKTLFEYFFKGIPPYELTETTIVVKGPSGLEPFVTVFKDKFKELISRELVFQKEDASTPNSAQIESKTA